MLSSPLPLPPHSKKKKRNPASLGFAKASSVSKCLLSAALAISPVGSRGSLAGGRSQDACLGCRVCPFEQEKNSGGLEVVEGVEAGASRCSFSLRNNYDISAFFNILLGNFFGGWGRGEQNGRQGDGGEVGKRLPSGSD